MFPQDLWLGPLMGWHLNPRTRTSKQELPRLTTPKQVSERKQPPTQLWCPVWQVCTLGFRIRARRHAAPGVQPTLPSARVGKAPCQEQDRKRWMAQGVAWAGRSGRALHPVRLTLTRRNLSDGAHCSTLESSSWAAKYTAARAHAATWRDTPHKDTPRGAEYTARTRHAATSETTRHTRARSGKTSATERPREASGMTEHRAAPQNPSAVRISYTSYSRNTGPLLSRWRASTDTH